MSAEEARKVYEELGKLFEKEKTDLQKFKEEYYKNMLKKEKEYIPYPVYPYNPIIIERWPVYPQPWTITYCSTTDKKYHFGDLPGTTSSLSNESNGQLLSINLT
ncbi:MAG: hypothetical protein Q7R95_02375 [bacterium]|nr:hypothetical protein [bacterium]